MSEGEGGVNTKSRILDLFSDLDEIELDSIEQWICSKQYKEDLQNKKAILKSDKLLLKIGNAIKKMVPLGGELPSEKIEPPTVGDQADCNNVNTLHLDEFLYDADQVEILVKEGKLTRHYCLDCNSRNVKELTFITHSMSRELLQYVFKVLLPKDLDGKQILDVGSRFGGLLYGAYYFTNAASIIGVEMNKECCEIQEKIIDKFSMDQNRIKVIHSDIADREDLMRKSDIFLMSVLDFFVSTEEHRKLWYFFKKHLRKGSYVVLNRSITETLSGLDINEEFMDWLSISKPCQMDNEIFFDIEDCNELYLYIVN